MNRLLSALRSIERRVDVPLDGDVAAASAAAPVTIEFVQAATANVGAQQQSDPLPVDGATWVSTADTIERLDADVARATTLVADLLAGEAIEPQCFVSGSARRAAAYEFPSGARGRCPRCLAAAAGRVRRADAAAAAPRPAPSRHEPPIRVPAVHLPPVQLSAAQPSVEYRKLAWRIAHDAGGRDRRWPILLVAARPQVLEQFDLAALAIALADDTDEVILIDGRQRQTLVAKQGASDQAGLAQVIAGRATWDDVIAPTNLPGVHFVAGALPSRAGATGTSRWGGFGGKCPTWTGTYWSPGGWPAAPWCWPWRVARRPRI